MQCLRPILVPNQSKFLITSNRDRLYNYVRCGKCAACQQNMRAEYEFRAYKQFEDCINRGGFVMFDTLTYSDKFVPRLRQFEEFSVLPSSLDYMCFNPEHITLFHKRLRKRLHKLGYDKAYSYFLATEYGTDDRFTHRPHIHILFYVYAMIDPLLFSRCVADSWNYGRTDGVPFKPAAYVLHNVFRSLTIGGRRVCNYVSKYVLKDNAFQSQLDRRVNHVLMYYAAGDLDVLRSDEFKRYRLALLRKVNQFHRQSLGFGLSALNGVDYSELVERGYFTMLSTKTNVMNKIPIANYYLRKMLYEVVTFEDGLTGWSLKDKYKALIRRRNDKMLQLTENQLRTRFMSVSMSVPSNIADLADYILNYRGRNIADDDLVLTLDERMCRANRYVYASTADKNHYNCRFVSTEYLGYRDHYIRVRGNLAPLKEYYDSHVYTQYSLQRFNGFDDLMNELQAKECDNNLSVQDAHDTIIRVSKSARSVYK